MDSDFLDAAVLFRSFSGCFCSLELGFDFFESAVRIFFDDFGSFVNELGEFVVPVGEDFDFEVIYAWNGQANAAAFANAVEELRNFGAEKGEVEVVE